MERSFKALILVGKYFWFYIILIGAKHSVRSIRCEAFGAKHSVRSIRCEALDILKVKYVGYSLKGQNKVRGWRLEVRKVFITGLCFFLNSSF